MNYQIKSKNHIFYIPEDIVNNNEYIKINKIINLDYNENIIMYLILFIFEKKFYIPQQKYFSDIIKLYETFDNIYLNKFANLLKIDNIIDPLGKNIILSNVSEKFIKCQNIMLYEGNNILISEIIKQFIISIIKISYKSKVIINYENKFLIDSEICIFFNYESDYYFFETKIFNDKYYSIIDFYDKLSISINSIDDLKSLKI